MKRVSAGTASLQDHRGGSQGNPLSLAQGTELCQRLHDLADKRRRFGYRRLFGLLRREGEISGLNRICRLYREERQALTRAWAAGKEGSPHSAFGCPVPRHLPSACSPQPAATGCSTCANRRIKPKSLSSCWMKVQWQANRADSATSSPNFVHSMQFQQNASGRKGEGEFRNLLQWGLRLQPALVLTAIRLRGGYECVQNVRSGAGLGHSEQFGDCNNLNNNSTLL